jgi:hypothetical protein
MAWDDAGFWANFTFVDKRAKTTNIRLQLQEPLYADAVADALLALGYIEACSDATCTRYEVTQRFDNDAWDYPASQCSVAEKAILTMRVYDKPGKKANFALPAPKIGVFTAAEGAGADVVDIEAAIVIALVGMFTPDGEVFISDGEEIAEIADGGFVVGRRSNRRYPATVG